MTNAIRNWMMIVLTLIFVVFYAAALLGWLRPLSDVTIVTRLEPIIFVIIGYYFGRMPAQQNEQTLKEEIIRQTQKSDAAQQAKEKANQECEALEEKIKNVVGVLSVSMSRAAPVKDFSSKESIASLHPIITAALNILRS